MLKKLLVLFVIILMTLIISLPVYAGYAATADLMIGRHNPASVGMVSVNHDIFNGLVNLEFHVDADTNGGWVLTENRIYVGVTAPQKSAPGKFLYSADSTADPDIWTCSVPLLLDYDQEFYVAVFAVLTRTEAAVDPVSGEPLLDKNGQPVLEVQEESSWASAGYGEDIPIPPGKNKATYFVLNAMNPE